MPTEKTQEYGYQLAYRLAREKLASIENLAQQCLNSGARLENSRIIIDYLNQTCQITLPDGDVLPVAGGELPMREKILILHYFTQAKGPPLSKRIIAYQELPDGKNYFPVFTKRAIKPLLDHFGGEPEKLVEVAQALGARRADFADAAVTFNAFSRVPVTFVLWKADEEFPASGNVMFDSTIPDYLTTDDTNVMCEIIAWRLVRLKDRK